MSESPNTAVISAFSAGMNRIQADLIYKISSFLSLNYLLMIELIISTTRDKMIASKSAY